jgi:hypothetical protein
MKPVSRWQISELEGGGTILRSLACIVEATARSPVITVEIEPSMCLCRI